MFRSNLSFKLCSVHRSQSHSVVLTVFVLPYLPVDFTLKHQVLKWASFACLFVHLLALVLVGVANRLADWFARALHSDHVLLRIPFSAWN